jgi:hypothetical protein
VIQFHIEKQYSVCTENTVDFRGDQIKVVNVIQAVESHDHVGIARGEWYIFGTGCDVGHRGVAVDQEPVLSVFACKGFDSICLRGPAISSMQIVKHARSLRVRCPQRSFRRGR